MSNPGKGGRGKKAPYNTIHYRIPEPIKSTVEKLADVYRFFVSTKGSLKAHDELINPIRERISAILDSSYNSGDEESELRELRKHLEFARERIHQLELKKQEVSNILIPALKLKSREGTKMKELIETALKKLAE